MKFQLQIADWDYSLQITVRDLEVSKTGKQQSFLDTLKKVLSILVITVYKKAVLTLTEVLTQAS